MERGERVRRLLFGHHQSIAGTVYGTIVVMATVAAGSHGEGTEAWALAVAVAVTVLVLWLAHVYSHTLAESLHRGRRLDAAEFTSLARREASIPLAAVLPIAMLLLAVVGVLKVQTAAWVALGLGVATLAVQGARYAAVERLGPGATAVSIALNVSLGLVIVGLKALIVH
jgi:hypothetical protein